MKKNPSIVQLPGGVRLNGVHFNIVEYDEHGRPKKFQICPKYEKGELVLYADETWLRGKHK